MVAIRQGRKITSLVRSQLGEGTKGTFHIPLQGCKQDVGGERGSSPPQRTY